MSDDQRSIRRPWRPTGSSPAVSRFLRRDPKFSSALGTENPRFLIVEDHPLVRRGISQLLQEIYTRAIVDEAESVESAMSQIHTANYDLVILDLSLPQHSGLEALDLVHAQRSELRVAIFSMHAERQFAIRALRAGAHAYITKDQTSEQFLAAIRKTLAGGIWVSDTLAESLTREATQGNEGPPHVRLSPRELKVLNLLAAGHTVGEISRQLSLSIKTISTYRTRLLEKLDMKTNAEITRYCLDHDLLQ